MLSVQIRDLFQYQLEQAALGSGRRTVPFSNPNEHGFGITHFASICPSPNSVSNELLTSQTVLAPLVPTHVGWVAAVHGMDRRTSEDQNLCVTEVQMQRSI